MKNSYPQIASKEAGAAGRWQAGFSVLPTAYCLLPTDFCNLRNPRTGCFEESQ